MSVCLKSVFKRTSNIGLFAIGVSLPFGQLSTTKIPDLYAIFKKYNYLCGQE